MRPSGLLDRRTQLPPGRTPFVEPAAELGEAVHRVRHGAALCPSSPPRPRPTPRVRHPPNPLRGSRASVLQNSRGECARRDRQRAGERLAPLYRPSAGATSYGTLCRSLTRRDSPQRILRAGWVWNGPHPRELGDAVTTRGSYRGLGAISGPPIFLAAERRARRRRRAPAARRRTLSWPWETRTARRDLLTRSPTRLDPL